jgi:hypothetical protein
MYNTMLRNSGSKLVLETKEVIQEMTCWYNESNRHNGPTETFITMIGGGYASEAREEASKLLDMTCSQLASSLPGEAAKKPNLRPGRFVNTILRPFTAQLSTNHVPPIPAVQGLFEKCLQILPELVDKKELDGLTGWALRPRGCKKNKGEKCKDCVIMDEFLASETRQVWEFISAEHKERAHIQLQLGVCAHVTLRTQTPHTLVVKKTMTEEDRVEKQHAATMKTLNSALEPLRVEYVKELLGEEKYQELVMLETTNPSKKEVESSLETATTDPLKREAESPPETTTTNTLKREAEGSPEAASKRQR